MALDALRATKDIGKTASNLTIYASDTDIQFVGECLSKGESESEGNSILDVSLTTTASTSSVTTVAIAADHASNSCDYDDDEQLQQVVMDEFISAKQAHHVEEATITSRYPEQQAADPSQGADREDCQQQQDDDIDCRRGALAFPSSVSSLCKFFGVHTMEIFSGGTYVRTRNTIICTYIHTSKYALLHNYFCLSQHICGENVETNILVSGGFSCWTRLHYP